MRPLPLLILAILVLIGCGRHEHSRFMGNWTGGFVVTGVDEKTDPKERQGESFKGFLQLYRGQDQYKLHLNSPKQAIDVTGKWKIEDDRILLSVGEIVFDNPSEAEIKTTGIRIVTPDEFRNTLGRTVVLDLAADRKRAEGLPLNLGFLKGQLVFEKGAATRRVEQVYDGMNKNR